MTLVESLGLPVLREIADGKDVLFYEERLEVATYLAMQHCRTPVFIDGTQRRYERMVHATTHLMGNMRGVDEETLSKLKVNVDGKFALIQSIKLAVGIAPDDGDDEPPKPSLADILMKWMWYRVEIDSNANESFVLTDNPAHIFNFSPPQPAGPSLMQVGGWMGEHNILTFPINPRTLILLRAPTREERQKLMSDAIFATQAYMKIEQRSAPAAGVRGINENLAAVAGREIISASKDTLKRLDTKLDLVNLQFGYDLQVGNLGPVIWTKSIEGFKRHNQVF